MERLELFEARRKGTAESLKRTFYLSIVKNIPQCDALQKVDMF